MTGRSMTTRAAPMSSDLYPIPVEPEVTRLIFGRVRRDRDASTGQMIIEEPLTSDERQMIDARLHALAGPLTPARPAEVRGAVLQMLAGFNTAKTGDENEAKAIVAQYLLTLQGLPAFAIRRACLRFAQGNVTADEVGEDRIIKGIHPPTPYVRIIAEKIARPYWDEASLGSLLLRAKIAPPPPTEAELSRRKEKAQAARDEIARASAKLALEEARRDAEKSEVTTARAIDRDREEKIRHYTDRGLDPVFADTDKKIVVSLPMMLNNGWRIEQVDGRQALTRGGAR